MEIHTPHLNTYNTYYLQYILLNYGERKSSICNDYGDDHNDHHYSYYHYYQFIQIRQHT